MTHPLDVMLDLFTLGMILENPLQGVVSIPDSLSCSVCLQLPRCQSKLNLQKIGQMTLQEPSNGYACFCTEGQRSPLTVKFSSFILLL